jgi:hypothetical protein
MQHMPELTIEQLTLGFAVAAGVALLSLIVALVCVAKLRKARREYVILRGENGERDIISAVGRNIKEVKELNARIDSVVAANEEQGTISRFAVQRFNLVRYDAYDDMGGQMSFSAALLDEHGDGLIFTSINGRTEARTYAKPVKGLTSQHNLSPEEQQAIAGAAAGEGRGEVTAASSSR